MCSAPNRWLIVGLLFAGMAVSYIDRGNMAVSAPVLMRELGKLVYRTWLENHDRREHWDVTDEAIEVSLVIKAHLILGLLTDTALSATSRSLEILECLICGLT